MRDNRPVQRAWATGRPVSRAPSTPWGCAAPATPSRWATASTLSGRAIRLQAADPIEDQSVGPVIGFYYPGREEPCDLRCRAAFLGNFWLLDEPLVLQPPCGQVQRFSNAEAAFQALKFWRRAEEFAVLSGEGAFRKKLELRGYEDFGYGGFGSNWKAMLAVLRAKFAPHTELARALRLTQGAFLLEHSSRQGRDTTWSDNADGSGRNWLGMQLMLVRAELAEHECRWSPLIKEWIDLETGEAASPASEEKWQKAVRHTSEVVRAALGEERFSQGRGPVETTAWGRQARCKRPGCNRPSYNGLAYEYCCRECRDFGPCRAQTFPRPARPMQANKAPPRPDDAVQQPPPLGTAGNEGRASQQSSQQSSYCSLWPWAQGLRGLFPPVCLLTAPLRPRKMATEATAGHEDIGDGKRC